MKVYGVHRGCRYEGCWLEVLFSTKEKAELYVLEKIKKESHPYNWTKSLTDSDCWEDRSDLLLILEHEIL